MRLGSVSRSVRPGEELCGLCITKYSFFCRHCEVKGYVCVVGGRGGGGGESIERSD